MQLHLILSGGETPDGEFILDQPRQVESVESGKEIIEGAAEQENGTIKWADFHTLGECEYAGLSISAFGIMDTTDGHELHYAFAILTAPAKENGSAEFPVQIRVRKEALH